MAEKIKIEALPVTDRFLRQKRLIQERGELALIIEYYDHRYDPDDDLPYDDF